MEMKKRERKSLINGESRKKRKGVKQRAWVSIRGRETGVWSVFCGGEEGKYSWHMRVGPDMGYITCTCIQRIRFIK